jgi:hypothetical protein
MKHLTREQALVELRSLTPGLRPDEAGVARLLERASQTAEPEALRDALAEHGAEALLRTRPIELGPVPAVPVRCAHCRRVRLEGEIWMIHPDLLEGEVVGMCPVDMALQRHEQRERAAREGRELLAARRRGYGPGDGDPFVGFREEGR